MEGVSKVCRRAGKLEAQRLRQGKRHRSSVRTPIGKPQHHRGSSF